MNALENLHRSLRAAGLARPAGVERIACEEVVAGEITRRPGRVPRNVDGLDLKAARLESVAVREQDVRRRWHAVGVVGVSCNERARGLDDRAKAPRRGRGGGA